MKQEFYSPDDRYPASPTSVNPLGALIECWDELEEENSENPQNNRNETLTIERDAQVTIEPPPGMPDAKPRYIQGVVVGQQACLVTNLLKQESITLRQSQMVWTIGRNRSAALSLQDRKLSRRHAVILYGDSRFYLIDLNSMNGSYINRHPA